ncbi:MAG: hypothetical protein K2X38_13575 [Gemmataceae bacterium]|nr:hypothetical protein [Gemmataceae bacterium]
MRISLFVLLFAVPSGFAEVPNIDPPIVGQPPNFSGIVGRVRVEVSVEPKEAKVEEPLIFVVRILGETSSKHPPRREALKVFNNDADRDFWVEPMPDRDTAKDGVWEFTYRLRPKHADAKETPAVKLVYFQPDRRRYQTSFADAIAIVIRTQPAVPAATEPKVLHAPAILLELAPPPPNLASQTGPRRFGAWEWVVAIVIPPLPCWFFARMLAWLYPPAEVRRRRAMHGAATRAIDELKRTDGQDAARSVETVKRYVAERFGWAVGEWGPHEAEGALKRRGIAVAARQACVGLLAAWDRDRFDPETKTQPIAWNVKAQQVIETVEADPCVASF